MLKRKKARGVQNQAVIAAVQTKSTADIDTLVNGLNADTPETRNRAAGALQEYGIESLGLIMASMQRHGIHIVAKPAMAPQGPIQVVSDVNVGGTMVPDQRKDAAGSSTRYVTIYLSSGTIDGLIPLANGDDTVINGLITQVLREFGDTAVEPLTRALYSPDKNTRMGALKIIGGMRDAKVIAPLANALNNPDKDTRMGAVRILGEMRDASVVEPLINASINPDKDVRLTAIRVLGEMMDIRATDCIMRALKDEDADVRNMAAIVIKGFNVPAISREKEIIKEIVKIPCGYCGTLVDITATKCPSCGAPLKH